MIQKVKSEADTYIYSYVSFRDERVWEIMAAIGWYGPLIDLSEAASHVGDFVQLLVFVHRSTPVQYKLSKGGGVIRTDIQVGDDTRPFFSVSIWQKQMGSIAFAGDIILLENVKITRFQEFVEARTVQCSSLQSLVHPYKLLVSKGVDDIIDACGVGVRTKEKLRKVIEWVQRTGSTLHGVEWTGTNIKRQPSINWKIHEEGNSQGCFSLLEVSLLKDSCKSTFYASIGEIFLPLTWKRLHESEEERMFISKRLCTMGDNNLAEDLICTGCQLCGSPLDSDLGSMVNQSTKPLYCPKSSNHLHMISVIYRPFMLYVWDESKYIPLLVTNKAAELLFGNIKAENVHSCYRRQKHSQIPKLNNVQNMENSDAKATKPDVAKRGIDCSVPPSADKSLGKEEREQSKFPNFYMIWLILLKVLMQHGKNSPMKFKVKVNTDRDMEGGRFEMVSLSMPCFGTLTSGV